jgi:hypothetical protein
MKKGLCECGCGMETTISNKTHRFHNMIKGEPMRYIQGHSFRGKKPPGYNGGRTETKLGYIRIYSPGHPRADSNGYVFEHILVVEKAIGNFLPMGAIVHHVDGNVKNNMNNNLIICQNTEYHHLLHRRQRALKACGHANWMICAFCKQFDDPINMYLHPDGRHAHHKECVNKYARDRRVKNGR